MILVERAPEQVTWSTPLDVDFVKGPLSGVSTYAGWQSASVTGATSVSIAADDPLAGEGFYYLVKPAGTCGTWQTLEGGEAGRDAVLP